MGETATSGGVEAWLRAQGEVEINHERMAHIVPHVKGRVARVDAHLGDDVRAALGRAYEAVSVIDFQGKTYRKDIGHRALSSLKGKDS